MNEQYQVIQIEHLKAAWSRGREQLEQAIPAEKDEDCFRFQAFGQDCELCPEKISLAGELLTGAEGILISLYARYVCNEPPKLHPLQSFKELPNSAPYQGAFVSRAEQIFVPHIPAVQSQQQVIVQQFSGRINTDAPSGDFSFTLYPLPRIPLYFIFYLADDEFPATATCLFAADATKHLPIDGLADVAEYTAKRIIELVR